MVVQIVGGIAANSLALLADSGHMFTDVVGIGLALGAIWLAGRPANDARTFGLYRLEILAAVANAALLFAVAGLILYESWRRLSEPQTVETGLMLAVAFAGLLANAVSLALLRDAQRESLNLRGAYMEVLSDLLGSVAVLVAAIVIIATGLHEADLVASALIAAFIIPRTWGLLREAVDVLLEATPRGVDLKEVRTHILGLPGVHDVHDLHAWTVTSGLNVVSAHVVLKDGADGSAVLDCLNECLSGDFDIEHSTFQLESSDRRRLEQASHA
ncbi:MAG: cation diffusion facilitator family transporter [Dehalococcoidia bacterium]|nr:cation diffusion facilitator family transporter [Dehalococcoidia bacterium]